MVLIVDDDVKIVSVIRLYLNRAGYETVEAYNGAAALDLCRRLSPEAVVLDWMLPRLDGISLLQRLRQVSAVPVLMLTARAEVADRVEGLEAGADDYLVKPFHPEELVARVRALLRRRAVERPDAEKPLLCGPLALDPSRHEVRLNDKAVPPLTAIEFRLLHALAENPGHVRTRESLLETIYSYGEKYVLDRTIDAHIAKVRSKLREVEPDLDLIVTVRGTGYKLGVGD